MKLKALHVCIAILFTVNLPAQNFTGQWKGSFIDQSTKFMGWGGDKCDYVLELETSGTNVTGYSYTYFTDGDKRYYTICKLKGTIDKRSQSVEVREYERTKTNVPQNIRNCFQVHRLTYFKKDDEQTLDGSWVPAPDQEGDCGYGTTKLSRRVLKKNPNITNLAATKKTVGRTPVVSKPKAKPVTNTAIAKLPVKKSAVPPVAKSKTTATTPPPVAKTTIVTKPTDDPVRDKPWLADNKPDKEDNVPVSKADNSFEKRNNTLIKTIEVERETVRIDLYDNGEIDGDSISLFLNGKLLLSHKRLSDKAITLNLDVTNNNDVNDLVMYADNLGSIPPNTALMVVTDGDKRYEVRISSDLQKSGSIRFIHKPKTGQ